MNALSRRFALASLALSLCVCSPVDAASPRIYEDVESQIVLRRFETQGAGDPIGTARIAVVLPPGDEGDVVILTWHEDGKSFTAEVYRALPPVNGLREWQAVGSDVAKKLSEQPGGGYAIQYTRPGPDGGLVSQRFRLPAPASAR